MADKVFISHSSKDMPIAKRLYGDLGRRGVACWMAPDDIDPGLDYQSSIVRAIRTAKVMLLIFTKNANDSREVSKEIALANKYGLLIIPARIDNVVPNDALEYELTTRQWHDLGSDWHGEMDGLAARIKRAQREGETATSEEPAETTEPTMGAPATRVATPMSAPAMAAVTPLPVMTPHYATAAPPNPARPGSSQIELRWTGIAMIVSALAYMGCVSAVGRSPGVMDDDNVSVFMALAVAGWFELAVGVAVYRQSIWARWPAFVLCALNIVAGIFFVSMLVANGSDGQTLTVVVVLVSAVNAAFLSYCAYVLYRW